MLSDPLCSAGELKRRARSRRPRPQRVDGHAAEESPGRGIGKQYGYWSADGIHFKIRLEDDRRYILVLMGATKDQKELIAVADGYSESLVSSRRRPCFQSGRNIDSTPRNA
ncbi:MAG: hypothetical protein SGJ20_07325 [Planctomycetota bacterium]|nr:hypothetical protein [Planctomycetota bacterium]